MITSWDMYWVVILDNIHSLSKSMIGLGFGSLIILWMLALCASMDMSEAEKKPWFKKNAGWSCWILSVILLGVFMYTFVPTTKQMTIILAVPKPASTSAVSVQPAQQASIAERKEVSNVRKSK